MKVVEEKKRRCRRCGQLVAEKNAVRHGRMCVENVYSCIYCDKFGMVERGLKLHLMACKGRPLLGISPEALPGLVEDIKTKQNKLKAKWRASQAKSSSDISDDGK